MGRTIDQDVHAAFVEFRAKGMHQLLPTHTPGLLTRLTQRTTNACQYSVSTANRSAQRIPLDRSSISSSALASRTNPMLLVHNRAQLMAVPLRQMASTAHPPWGRQLVP